MCRSFRQVGTYTDEASGNPLSYFQTGGGGMNHCYLLLGWLCSLKSIGTYDSQLYYRTCNFASTRINDGGRGSWK